MSGRVAIYKRRVAQLDKAESPVLVAGLAIQRRLAQRMREL
jgi:hypothetical protein